MVLSCSNLKKSFLEECIISNASFHIEDHDKVAIVGINGAGKTTLLRMLIGELSADEGSVTYAKEKTYGYLSQHDSVESENTIYEELLSVKQDIIDMENRLREMESAMKRLSGEDLDSLMNQYAILTHQFELVNGYSYKSDLLGVLNGLGFCEKDFSQKVGTLSGGQKTRVALGKLLLQNPDLIILDEPTNHLDMSSITWLENYLLNYKKAVLIVSHDRYFLDKITNKIIEIDQTKVSVFQGNYSDYSVKKEQLRIATMNAYLNQQKEIKHQEEVIQKLKSFNREKSIKRAESREKMLQKVEVLEKPTEVNSEMNFHLTPNIISGNDVLTVEGLSKSYPNRPLFRDINFTCKRGERIALIGNNGTGKTTILKILNEIVAADAGRITLGTNVHIGYYDQEHHVLNKEKTMFEEISDDYPTLTNTQIRNTLAAFLFTNDDVFKRIGNLSGGERGRVSLAKLMLSEANFLILDEPTNHLDIVSKEILESALTHYTGTVLFVSHDRYFINKTATRILDLCEEGLVPYIGNYDYYLEKKETRVATSVPIITKNVVTNDNEFEKVTTKNDWQQQKEEQAKQRKIANELRKVEERIEELELQKDDLETCIMDPTISSNSVALQEKTTALDSVTNELNSLYEKWEELSE